MSSWKKASKVNQKTHRERHQPASRAHLGLLEKKKDYVIRATDFNQKKKVIKTLKNRALERNPDEFYYHMVNSKIKDGQHVEKQKPTTEETVQQKLLMENKNITYVNMKRTIEKKKIDRLQANLHLVDLANSIGSRSHIKFDSDGEEIVDDESQDWNQTRLEQVGKLSLQNINAKTVSKLHNLKTRQYEQLARRIGRHKELAIIQEKMNVQKALKRPAYERPQLIKQGTKSEAPIYKWKYERKR